VGTSSSVLRGVAGTGLTGLWGRPFLPLDDLLDLGAVDDVHEEICLALAQVPLDYTGGSHRSMGIMPASLRDDGYGDYGEAIRGMTDAQWRTFASLSDEPERALEVERGDVGEERSLPLSRRQMLWLKARFGVYFPWQAYLELIPNRSWSDKANAEGKSFTSTARRFLPKTIAFVQSLPFARVGRCNVMGLDANDHGTVHRDGDPAEQTAPDHFVTICPARDKRLFLWDEANKRKHVVDARAYWFNDFDHHGVEAAPRFRYSLRVDGVFTDAFLARLAERFA
jgi:hypothetical protein